VFEVGAEAAGEEGGYEGLGCLGYDMVVEVLFGAECVANGFERDILPLTETTPLHRSSSKPIKHIQRLQCTIT